MTARFGGLFFCPKIRFTPSIRLSAPGGIATGFLACYIENGTKYR